MADASDQTTQMFGEQGEPCQECGALLAADQRYCLNCGRRRADPRIDYRHYMSSTDSTGQSEPSQNGAVAPQATDAAEAAGKPERDYAPLAAVGGIAVLGLMLLVGVLIGKGNNTTSTAPAPIVKIGEGGESSGGESGESKNTSTKPKSKKGKTVDTGAKSVKGGLTGDAARNSNSTVQASKNDLESLNESSGEAYEESIKKLPDKIATPGKPPPIDKTKAPGGGGSAETIE